MVSGNPEGFSVVVKPVQFHKKCNFCGKSGRWRVKDQGYSESSIHMNWTAACLFSGVSH